MSNPKVTPLDDPAGSAPTLKTRPGDEAVPGAPGAGENLCPRCGGSGRIAAAPCPECEGTGRIAQAVGGA